MPFLTDIEISKGLKQKSITIWAILVVIVHIYKQKYKTQSQGKVYFWWHHILNFIGTKIKICYCLLDTGGHSYIQYFMSLWFICQLDTKTYNYITKNSKIDPKNSKNGDIFFKISSNIYHKKYRIHWFLYVFFAKFKDCGCMNLLNFFQTSISKDCIIITH